MTKVDKAQELGAVGSPLDGGVRPPSAKARKLLQALEAMGHRSVRVWWQPLGMAMEMCGPSGGWFCQSDMTHFQPEPLGYSFGAAMHAVQHHSWLDFRHVPRAA